MSAVVPAPYLTVAELQDAPTGIDWSSIPMRNATTSQQQAAQLRLVWRATNHVDTICRQKLRATADVDTWKLGSRRARGSPGEGYYIRSRYFPIIAVQSVQISVDLVNFFAVSGVTLIEPANEDAVRIVPPVYASLTGAGWGPSWIQMAYWDGFANGYLTADVDSGVTSLPMDNPIGVQPGDILTIRDTQYEEQVPVASDYTAGASPVLLAQATAYAHNAGTLLSEMPPAVREATILIATHFARERGRATVSIMPSGTQRSVSQPVQSQQALLDEAATYLARYMRVL